MRSNFWHIIPVAIIAFASSSAPGQNTCPIHELSIFDQGVAQGGAQSGAAVAVSGEYAAVGAPFDSAGAPNSGSVRLYRLSGASWQYQGALVASDGTTGDRFGAAIAMDGNILVVGAPDDDDAGANYGAVYIFERFGSLWIQTAKITPPGATTDDYFGRAVAVEGSRLVIGSTPLSPANRGSVYIYEKSGISWQSKATFSTSSGNLGAFVSLSGTRVAAAAQYNVSGSGHSTLYLFELTGSTWSTVASLTPSGGSWPTWGVAISGNSAFISGGGSGNVSRYAYSISGWQFSEVLPINGLNLPGGSGSSLAIHESSLIVGTRSSYPESDGRAFIYQPTPFGWRPAIAIDAEDSVASDPSFGVAVAVDGNHAVVGSPFATTASGPTGTATIFPSSTDFAFLSHGPPCAGTGGFAPVLKLSGCAVPSGSVTLNISNGLGGSTAIVGIGLQPFSQPMEGGCLLSITPVFPNVIVLPLFGAGSGAGAIQITAPLPPTIVPPVSIELQGFLVDSGVPHGYTTTNAVRMSIAAN